MRYLALACDYDGTLASGGRVSAATVAALEDVIASGRKLVLVTGRQLDDLLSIFPDVQLFDYVVAENGALLYQPSSRRDRLLAEPPPPALLENLRAKDVEPLSSGKVIVATSHPNEASVLQAIRELGVEAQIIFNKGSVMVLPAGVNKATGLSAALRELGLSPHNVAGIGDAENDHAFLAVCELSAAVANALPSVKERADAVTSSGNGSGVRELASQLVATDLRRIERRVTRHDILVGTEEDGGEFRISPYRTNLLLAGSSGGGKSTLATALVERLVEQGYQCCIVDPEGDYESLEEAIMLGNRQRPPSIGEVMQLLENPDATAAVNLLGVPLQDRPAFLAALFPRLLELRARTGRPHWVVLDEAHHLLPSPRDSVSLTLPQDIDGLVIVTVKPDQVAPAAMALVNTVMVVGDAPRKTMKAASTALKRSSTPRSAPKELQPGQVLVWPQLRKMVLIRLATVAGRSDRKRHRRKYAEGDLGEDKSFYFRGPDERLNLRAHNLVLFLQIAEGVDDDTWLHHLRQGDYERWFRDAIKDDVLAAAARLQRSRAVTADESRAELKALIEEHYTLPASGGSSKNGSPT